MVSVRALRVTWTEFGPEGVLDVLDELDVVDEPLPVPELVLDVLEEALLDEDAVPDELEELDEQDDVDVLLLDELPHGLGDGPRLPGGAIGVGENE